MGGIVDCLEFTVESQEDFADSWLPTLDINIQIDSGNMVNYRFYEKPSISQVCLQKGTALSRNSLVQSLSEDTKRRMMNSSSRVPDSERIRVIDKWAQKMINSGHGMKEVRSIVISGLKGYYSKLKKCQKTGAPVHRSAKLSF